MEKKRVKVKYVLFNMYIIQANYLGNTHTPMTTKQKEEKPKEKKQKKRTRTRHCYGAYTHKIYVKCK